MLWLLRVCCLTGHLGPEFLFLSPCLQALQYLLDDVSSFLRGMNTGGNARHSAKADLAGDEAEHEWIGPRQVKGGDWPASTEGTPRADCDMPKAGSFERPGASAVGAHSGAGGGGAHGASARASARAGAGEGEDGNGPDGGSGDDGGGLRPLLRSFLDHIAVREAQNCAARRREDENAVTITTIHQVPITTITTLWYGVVL